MNTTLLSYIGVALMGYGLGKLIEGYIMVKTHNYRENKKEQEKARLRILLKELHKEIKKE